MKDEKIFKKSDKKTNIVLSHRIISSIYSWMASNRAIILVVLYDSADTEGDPKMVRRIVCQTKSINII